MFDKKQIPNILSIVRLLMVPLFIIVYFGTNRVSSLIGAAIIYSAAGITDVVDGYLARKNNWITDMGKFLDPLADKLMQAAAAFCLVIDGLLPVLVLIVFIIKELTMLIGGIIILKKRNTVVASIWVGKFATAVFYLTVMFLIISSAFWTNRPDWVYPTVGTVLAITIIFAVVMYYKCIFKEKYGLQIKGSSEGLTSQVE